MHFHSAECLYSAAEQCSARCGSHSLELGQQSCRTINNYLLAAVSPPDQWPGDPGHSPPSSCRNKCGAGCTCNNVIGGDGERPGPGHTGSQGDYWTQCRSSANRGKIAVNPVPHWAAGSRDPGRCVTEMFNMVTHNSPAARGGSLKLEHLNSPMFKLKLPSSFLYTTKPRVLQVFR